MTKSNISGQTNERNAVALIKKHAPFFIKLSGKEYCVVDAEQLGGGNPEPKADIALHIKEGKTIKKIGVSMKKPNFGFFESWMNAEKVYTLLMSIGIESKDANEIVAGLIKKAETISKSKEFKKQVLNEYAAMVEVIGRQMPVSQIAKDGNKFKIKNFVVTQEQTKKIQKLLLNDPKKRFGSNKIGSSFEIPNIYVPLRDLLGSKFKKFLQNTIGGTSTNKFKADYVLIQTIQTSLTKKQLIEALEQAESIEDVIKKYNNNEDVNIKFRLRPITTTRSLYSTTNAGKFRKGSEFYNNDDIGISWTVQVVK